MEGPYASLGTVPRVLSYKCNNYHRTELVVGPLIDPVISEFHEKVEIRVRMRGVY